MIWVFLGIGKFSGDLIVLGVGGEKRTCEPRKFDERTMAPLFSQNPLFHSVYVNMISVLLLFSKIELGVSVSRV